MPFFLTQKFLRLFFIFSIFFLVDHAYAQRKKDTFWVNKREKKLYIFTSSTSKYEWYGIHKRIEKDSIETKQYKRLRTEIEGVLDSLAQKGFTYKYKTEDFTQKSKVNVEILKFEFYAIDSLKNDSVYKVDIKFNVSTEKPAITKSFIYCSLHTKYTKHSLSQFFLTHKPYSLTLYKGCEIFKLVVYLDWFCCQPSGEADNPIINYVFDHTFEIY